jgi:hypothetical protein
VVLFPALIRMRTLARKTSALAESEQNTEVPVTSPGMHAIIAAMAEDVIRTRIDLVHCSILFYFYSNDRRTSLPFALLLRAGIASRGMESISDPLFASLQWRWITRSIPSRKISGERLGLRDRSLENVLPKFSELHRVPLRRRVQ